MASNFLAGLGGFLSGGFGAFNAATAREDELSEKDRQFQLQQEQLRRAIANDERIAAQAEAQLGIQREQAASLDDQRKFQASAEMIKQGFDGPIRADALHPTVREFATEALPQPTAPATLLGLEGDVLQRGEAVSNPIDYVTPKQSNSERLQIAQLNATQRAAQSGANREFQDRKLAQERDIAMQRIMASILNAQANGPGGRGSTGAEKKDLQFFNRMLQAERDARSVESDVSNWDLGVNEWSPGLVENWLKSPKGQQYTAAQRAFTEARLRKESGAAINAGEFDTDRRVNFRISGDAPEGFADKRRRRLTTLRGLGFSSGKAFQEYYGPDATLDSVLAEFADQQAAAGVPGGGGGAAAPGSTPTKQPKRIRFDAQGNVIQ